MADQSRLGQKKEQAIKNAGGNDVEVTEEGGETHLDQETGGGNGDWDSNVSAAAGNPNGRGAGKDPGPLTHETDRHDRQSREEQNRELQLKERGSLPTPDTGARRGDLDAPVPDRGGTYSPINNGSPPGRH